jgi:hypothetical protein
MIISCLKDLNQSRFSSCREGRSSSLQKQVQFSPTDQSYDDLKTSLEKTKRIAARLDTFLKTSTFSNFYCSKEYKEAEKQFLELSKNNLPPLSEKRLNLPFPNTISSSMHKILVLQHAISKADLALNKPQLNIWQKAVSFLQQGWFCLDEDEAVALHNSLINNLKKARNATLDDFKIDKEELRVSLSPKKSPTSPIFASNPNTTEERLNFQEHLKKSAAQARLFQKNVIGLATRSHVSSEISKMVVLFGRYKISNPSDGPLNWESFQSLILEEGKYSEEIITPIGNMVRLHHLGGEARKISNNQLSTQSEMSSVIKKIELEMHVLNKCLYFRA